MKKFVEITFYIIVSIFLCVALHNTKDKFEKVLIKEISNLSISYAKNDSIGVAKHTKKFYQESNKKIDKLQVK